MTQRRHTGQDRRGIMAAAMLLGALAAVPAQASGGASCSLTATPLGFGDYVPFSSMPDDVTATITVTCTATGGTTVPVQGSISLTSVSTTYGRQLADGTYILRYHTYLDPARTVFWGDGSGLGATEPVSGMVGPSTPFQQAFTVYGRVLARQYTAHVGPYADLITAILNY
ncbi:MAG: spore coat U domain-containing protein [Acetobacteraceae bacterium]|jgi:spore coat protein U-like protein